MKLDARCPACLKRVIPIRHKLSAAVSSNIRCPACGASVRLSFWPRLVHLAFGELAIAAGFVASLSLETPLYLGLASASWFGLGLALPLSTSPVNRTDAPGPGPRAA